MADNSTSVKITADASQFESEMRRIATLADGAGSKLTSAFKGVGLAMAGIGAGVGLSTLKDKFDSVIASASALKEMSEKTGASVENLSGLAAVAKITATDMGLVEAAMNKLSKGLHASDEDAKGAGKALDFLGLKLKDLRGQDSAENLKLVADKFNDIEEGTGKVALAMAIFGKNGAQMLAFLKDLSQNGDLVVKTTTSQADAAKAYEQDLRRLTATKEALYKTVGLELAPAFDTFVKALIGAKNETNGVLKAGKDLAADGSIREWGLQAVEVAGWVVDGFDGIARLFRVVGKGLGAMAAETGAALSGNFSQVAEIEKLYQADREAILMAPLFSDKLKGQTDALRAHWAQVEAVKKAYASFPKDIQQKALKALDDSYYGTNGGTRSANSFTAAADPRNAKSAAATKVDDYTRIIQQLNEKISVEQANIESVGKLGQAEKDYAKYQADVASGATKLTAEQKRVAGAYWEVYLARAKQREFADAVDKQTEANRLQTMAMEDQIRALDKQVELYGLTESQISVVEQARLADAIALAKENGAGEDQIAVLEKELALRGRLSDALIRKDTKKQEIDDAIKKVQDSTDEMSEFAKQAAHNMQDAMANFFLSPMEKGIKGLATSFGETVQKMIAQAASAQLLKTLFGDMGKTGSIGSDSLVGKGLSWLSGQFGGGSGSSLDWIKSYPTGGGLAFADGGIMTSSGALPLNKYASGGIANSPQLAMFGEGRLPEAYVPLPDGRRIPVRMQGGAGNTPNITVHVNSQTGDPAEIRRSAAAGARTALGLMSGARRYG